MTREQAWEYVCQWIQNENLRKHLLAVEAGMRYYARHFEENEEKWGLVGLLHDLDYEKHPEPPDHPQVGVQFLRERGLDEESARAILGHASWTGVPRDSLMAKALFACDELSGFLIACALVMPNKRLEEVRVETVLKKMKDKAFARKVNRDEIVQGAQELGIPLEEHIRHLLTGLCAVADQLGL
ncbi:MAG: HDIG domain-containing protein [Armatimonadetes bacterium]|nr:HDIG domain-containing protein [Armatimonadota bacterium]MDW8122774.1 HDIG domain-containing protein [Armatimonadota bacterium]